MQGRLLVLGHAPSPEQGVSATLSPVRVREGKGLHKLQHCCEEEEGMPGRNPSVWGHLLVSLPQAAQLVTFTVWSQVSFLWKQASLT